MNRSAEEIGCERMSWKLLAHGNAHELAVVNIV
jgi:hypothetical protein